jgi:hypothetical protein
MAGVTLDTGVFIALERRQRRALTLWTEWTRTKTTLTVPAVVIAEWWRDRAWDAGRWLSASFEKRGNLSRPDRVP